MTLGQGNLLYNRYRIVEILGRGGMGAVYRAKDESLGVDVAVKENLFTTDDYARQFRMEAVILAGIRHPNLPRVTDHFVIDDMGQYLVMDYIEGDDLRQRMEKQGPISEEEAIRIGAAACNALSYLHSRKPPILHRDIKLGNIKLAPDGQVYLVDFGLAKMGWEHEETMTGARAMTPGYSPPEQYGSARTDARSDVYSLGATLYAAMTSIIPEDSLTRAVDGVVLTHLRERRPEISPRLAAVIEKALETAAANRYQSADAFKIALLGEAQTEQPAAKTVVKSNSSIKPTSTTDKQKPASALRSAGFWFLLLIIAGAAIMFNPLNSEIFKYRFFTLPFMQSLATITVQPVFTPTLLPASTETITPLPSSTILPTKNLAVLPVVTPTATITATSVATETTVPASAVPPLQATPLGGGPGDIAFASIVDSYAQIFIINSDGTNLRQLTNASQGACDFDWSPNGTQIVYVSPCQGKMNPNLNSGLYIFDLQTGESTALFDKPSGEFEPAWSPDGKNIAFTSMRDGAMQIYIFRLGDSKPLPLTIQDNNPQSRYPSWSPDSSQIIYTVLRLGLLQIWTMSADGSGKRQIVRTGGALSDYFPVWSPDGKAVFFSETNRELTAPSSLMRFDMATSKVEQISLPRPVVDVHFSPDGLWIVYETSDAVNQDIYTDKLSEGFPRRMTTSGQVDFDPAWRP